MVDILILECAEADTDTLQVKPSTHSLSGDKQLELNCSDRHSYAIIFLDSDRARKLFNYLGIWLHKNGGE